MSVLRTILWEAVESCPVTSYDLCEVRAEKEGEFYVHVTAYRNKFL